MMTIKYKRGFKYQLYEDYSFDVDEYPDEEIYCGRYLHFSETGVLTLHNGYCWDGPSGPTIDTANFMRGSLIHDALYQLVRNECLPEDPWRQIADEALQRICLEDGMSRFRAWYVYRSVRGFGGGAATHNPKAVLCAP